MSLEPLLFVVALVAMAGATLSLILILAHRPLNIPSPQAEADALRVRTLPPGGTAFALDALVASPSGGVRERWEVKSDMTWPVYRKWVRKQLSDYVCIQGAERLALIRTIPEHGVRTLSVEPEACEEGCRVHIDFTAVSK